MLIGMLLVGMYLASASLLPHAHTRYIKVELKSFGRCLLAVDCLC